jgi:hypothetical protein
MSRRIAMFRVYSVIYSGKYSGGVAVVVAESPEQAMALAADVKGNYNQYPVKATQLKELRSLKKEAKVLSVHLWAE